MACAPCSNMPMSRSGVICCINRSRSRLLRPICSTIAGQLHFNSMTRSKKRRARLRSEVDSCRKQKTVEFLMLLKCFALIVDEFEMFFDAFSGP